jgi:ornithine cyclodeaminase
MQPFPVRVISGRDVRRLLSYEECVGAVDAAMRRVSGGGALMPLRTIMRLPSGQGALGMMPGYLSEPAYFGIKLLSLFPGNPALGLSSHLGLHLVCESVTGRPVALIEASSLTAIRTAAASVVATRALARPESTVLAIIGTGEEARSHLDAFQAVRPFSRVLVWGRNADAARNLAQEYEGRAGATLEVVPTVPRALAEADVVCTLTSSPEPIVFGRDVRPGTHLCLVGSSIPVTREVDDDCVAMARFFVDYRESAMAQAGELLGAIRSGRVTEAHIAGEIGDVLSGRVVGREHSDQVTVYKSLGVAAQDLAAAAVILRSAEAEGVGQLVEI